MPSPVEAERRQAAEQQAREAERRVLAGIMISNSRATIENIASMAPNLQNLCKPEGFDYNHQN